LEDIKAEYLYCLYNQYVPNEIKFKKGRKGKDKIKTNYFIISIWLKR